MISKNIFKKFETLLINVEISVQCMETIETFRYLMSRANDIYNNRIEKVLREMDSVMLYTLPTNEAWTLDRFLDEIKGTCKEAANDLHRSSVMIEDAVEDLISLGKLCLNNKLWLKRRIDCWNDSKLSNWSWFTSLHKVSFIALYQLKSSEN